MKTSRRYEIVRWGAARDAVRVGGPAQGHEHLLGAVEVVIDHDKLAQVLGARALGRISGRLKMLGGAIVVERCP